jgi:hypothetical protein
MIRPWGPRVLLTLDMRMEHDNHKWCAAEAQKSPEEVAPLTAQQVADAVGLRSGSSGTNVGSTALIETSPAQNRAAYPAPVRMLLMSCCSPVGDAPSLVDQ